MIFIYIFMTTLATAVLAQGSAECNFSAPAGSICVGAVGQPLIFYLPKADIRLIKDESEMVLSVVTNDHSIMHEGYMNQSELFTNGIFKVGKAMKSHSGVYTLKEYASNGALVRKVALSVQIKAPVSKPVISQMCLSVDQLNISCSSEGDEVEFMLTLDHLLLMQTREHSMPSTNWSKNMQPVFNNNSVSKVYFSLHGQLMGHLTCQARNQINREEKSILLTGCNDSPSISLIILGAIVAGFVLLLPLAFHLVKILLQKTQRNTPVRERDNKEDDVDEVDNIDKVDEVVYSDIRVKENTRTK